MLGESQRFVVLVLLVVGVSDGARPVEPRSAAHHFELAREYSSEYDEKSDELALKHFRTAAELGHPGAFYELGVRHLHGWGVPESPFLAHVMLSVAVVEYDRIRSVAETDRAVARRDRIDSSLTDEHRSQMSRGKNLRGSLKSGKRFATETSEASLIVQRGDAGAFGGPL